MNKTHIRCFLFVVLILTFGTLGFAQVTQCTIADSIPLGICGPYRTHHVTGSNGSNVNVMQDFWNQAKAPSGSTQTMHSISPENWYVDASFPTGNTAVETYPDSDAIYYGPSYTGSGCTHDCRAPSYSTIPKVSSFTSLYSSWKEDMNAGANTSAEAAYDVWLNHYANEVMIWVDTVNRGLNGCTSLASKVSFGGRHGVPVHLWNLCRYNRSRSDELVWYLDQPSLGAASTEPASSSTVYGLSRGSVDVHAMLMWLERNGELSPDSDLYQLEFGFEISSTGGKTERFQLHGWSVTDTQKKSRGAHNGTHN